MPGTIAAFRDEDGEAAFDVLGRGLVMNLGQSWQTYDTLVPVAGTLEPEAVSFKQFVLPKPHKKTNIKRDHHIPPG